MKPFLALLLFLFGFQLLAQERIVQVSGVILTTDSSAQHVPNANISVIGRDLNSQSGDDGFFSMVAVPGDSILIKRFGFEPSKLYIPDSLIGDAYLAIVTMQWLSVELEEVILYPWPRPEALNRELLSMKGETTERDIAMRNLALSALKEQAAAMGMDPGQIQRYAIKAQEQNLYDYGRNGAFNNAGSAILGRLSNPFAWAQFFKAIKQGDFN